MRSLKDYVPTTILGRFTKKVERSSSEEKSSDIGVQPSGVSSGLPQYPKQNGQANLKRFNTTFSRHKTDSPAPVPNIQSRSVASTTEQEQISQEPHTVQISESLRASHAKIDRCMEIDWGNFEKRDPAVADHVKEIQAQCRQVTENIKKKMNNEVQGLAKSIGKDNKEEIEKAAKDQTRKGVGEAMLSYTLRPIATSILRPKRLAAREAIQQAEEKKKEVELVDKYLSELLNAHPDALREQCDHYCRQIFEYQQQQTPQLLDQLKNELGEHAQNVIDGLATHEHDNFNSDSRRESQHERVRHDVSNRSSSTAFYSTRTGFTDSRTNSTAGTEVSVNSDWMDDLLKGYDDDGANSIASSPLENSVEPPILVSPSSSTQSSADSTLISDHLASVYFDGDMKEFILGRKSLSDLLENTDDKRVIPGTNQSNGSDAKS
jgi:hypothetical protein